MKINLNQTMKKATYFIMFFMMIINFLCETFKIPTIFRYISDIIVLFMTLYIIGNLNKIFRKKFLKKVFNIFLLFILTTLIGYILKLYPITLYIWGLRNICRFFIVFFTTAIVFNDVDIKKIYNIYHVIFAINIILALYQYFILGYWADAIGGTFRLGNKGGNAGLLFLLIIENIYVFSDFLNKKVSVKKFLFVVMSSMVISALAELKVFYIVFIGIVVLSLAMNGKSIKTIIIGVGAILALYIGVLVLGEIAPKSVEILSFDGIKEYVAGQNHGYSSKNDISRGRAFKQINELFFYNSNLEKIFGYGLGSCDVSSIEIFCSSFYKVYESLHYTWFMHSMLFLETGYIGYGIYILFFVYCIASYKYFIKNDRDHIEIYNSGIILSIICIIMTWYNAALRNDVAFFIYISLAMPFAKYYNSVSNGITKKVEGDKIDSK